MPVPLQFFGMGLPPRGIPMGPAGSTPGVYTGTPGTAPGTAVAPPAPSALVRPPTAVGPYLGGGGAAAAETVGGPGMLAGVGRAALPWLGRAGVAGAAATYAYLGQKDLEAAVQDPQNDVMRAARAMDAETAKYRAQGDRAGEMGAAVRGTANVALQDLQERLYPKRTMAFLSGLFGAGGATSATPPKPVTSAKASGQAPAQVTSVPATPQNAALEVSQQWDKAYPNMPYSMRARLMPATAAVTPQARTSAPPGFKDVMGYQLLNMDLAELRDAQGRGDTQREGEVAERLRKRWTAILSPNSAMLLPEFNQPMEP